MDPIEVVVAHTERATVRVGDVFLKIDPDRARVDAEVEAMALAPVPTAEILWRQPPVLALAALPGRALGRLELPSTATPAAWRAAGAAVRRLHEAPSPDRAGRTVDQLAERLHEECRWLVDQEVLPRDVVEHNRRLAETALRPWREVFMHGDLQITHVFTADHEITGILDWSEAARGDGIYDLATLTLAHEENLDDLLTGYGVDVDRDLIRAWWSYRSLVAIRWLAENGYGAPETFPETAVLLSAGGG
ncbi:MAG TPA: phosphotransferase [Candidatus Nanopelagicales bacterium]|nr:phosphotransferase [Candidatus Nanopelagicales bacterium]